MKILVDAMGGDNAPDAVIKGAAAAIHCKIPNHTHWFRKLRTWKKSNP